MELKTYCPVCERKAQAWQLDGSWYWGCWKVSHLREEIYIF